MVLTSSAVLDMVRGFERKLFLSPTKRLGTMDKFGMVGSGVRVWSFPRWITLSLRSQKREKNRTAKNLVDCGGVHHDGSGACQKIPRGNSAVHTSEKHMHSDMKF